MKSFNLTEWALNNRAGELVVTAGVQKMAPGLRVALLGTTRGEAAAKVAVQ